MGNAAPALNELTVWGRGWPVSTCSCHGELYTGVLQGVGCSRVWQDGASHQAINRLATWALCPGSMDPPMLGWREACMLPRAPSPPLSWDLCASCVMERESTSPLQTAMTEAPSQAPKELRHSPVCIPQSCSIPTASAAEQERKLQAPSFAFLPPPGGQDTSDSGASPRGTPGSRHSHSSPTSSMSC